MGSGDRRGVGRAVAPTVSRAWVARLVGVGLGAAAATAARADDDGEPATEELTVYGARSYGAPEQATARADAAPREVPQGLTVVPRDLVDDLQARRTEDVLLHVPGVQLGSGYGGTWDDYHVRGFRVWAGTVSRNGFLAGYSGANATDAVVIERVEVLRGPASALWGPGLPGGAVNVVTRRPREGRHAEVGLFTGSFGTHRVELDVNHELGDGLRGRVLGAGETTDGYRDFNVHRRGLLDAMLEADLGPSTRLLLEFEGYQQGYRADPYGVPLGPELPVERSFAEPHLPLARTRGALVRMQLDHGLGERWALHAALQSKRGDYEELALFPIAVDPDAGMARIAVNWGSDSQDLASQVWITGSEDTGAVSHALLFGADAGIERVRWNVGTSDPGVDPYFIDLREPSYGAPLPAAPLPDGEANRWDYRVAGVYAQDRLELTRHVAVSVGGRLDTYAQRSVIPGAVDETAGRVLPSGRAGLVVTPVEPLTVYASASNGHWPALGVAADGGVLQDEHAVSAEAGARVVAPDDALLVDLAAFHTVNGNISVPDPERPEFQVQRGEATSRGLEGLVAARPAAWLRAWVTYALTDARISDDPDAALIGEPLPLTAAHAGSAWGQLELPLSDGSAVTVGGGGVYTGERALLDGATIDGYVRADGAIGYTTRSVRCQLRAENLADARYVRTGTDALGVLPGAPRSLMLSVHVRR